MTFQDYQAHTSSILQDPAPSAPYDDAHFLEYTKLNQTRTKRWLKTGKLAPHIAAKIQAIAQPQKWIVITEPWCGDAAHIVPFIQLMAQENPNISVDYELRDTPPYRIDQYLTNGGKAIPKLIIQDSNGQDLYHWGPRPAACQHLFLQLKEQGLPMEEQKIALQEWYNQDHGQQITEEIIALLP